MTRHIIAIVATLLLVVTACTKPEPVEAAPPGAAFPETVELTFTTQSGVTHTITAELAITLQARGKGLMFRESLPSDGGMLFVMPREEINGFYMKNTLIPLDMIHLAADGTVVGIIADTEPLNEATLAIEAPSKYVIEVNAGYASAHGITKGATVALPKWILTLETF